MDLHTRTDDPKTFFFVENVSHNIRAIRFKFV